MSGNGPPAGRPQGGPVARDQAADVPVEARRPLAGWRLEQPALLGPLLDGLLARQDRLLRQPRPGRAAGGGGAQLGHATASITLDTYGHLFPDELETLAAPLEDIHARALAVWPHGGPAVVALRESAGQ
jgi:hypothetical protein